MKKILVTGASGFIARHLIRKLSEKGDCLIYCLSRDRRKVPFFESATLKVIEADISSRDSLGLLSDIDFEVVFHCAALVGSSSLKDLRRANAGATENICRIALDKRVKRFIYLSSVAVVSGNTDLPLTEDLPYSATNNYGISKIEAEKVVIDYRSRGLPVCIFRPPMVYGEDEPHMMKKLLFLLKHRMLPLVNGGESKLHLVYVGNLVEALIYALNNKAMLEGSYFVADEEVLSVKEVFEAFCKGLSAKEPVLLAARLEKILLSLPFVGKRIGFLAKDRVYDIKRLSEAGFFPPYRAASSLAASARAVYYGGKKNGSCF